MPAHLIPHRSGLHRIAAIALYRALLSQAQRCPLAPQQRDELQNVVRTRFKQARSDTSQRQLKIRFAAGYEALDILDTAVAESEASVVESLLQRASTAAKQTPETILPKALRREQAKRDRRARQAQEAAAPKQEKPSLFARPLPLEKLSGARHVPVLFRANFVPVLRLKKPQPAVLSRYIRQRVKTRQQRFDRKHRLEAEVQLAGWEDEWDDIVNKNDGMGKSPAEKVDHSRMECRWTGALYNAIIQVRGQLKQEDVQFEAMATKMQGVVDRERALYDQEKSDRLRAKRAASLAKAKARREKSRVAVTESVADRDKETDGP
nr:hypothetical protein CFP56_64619 [Quercus suber]